MGIRTSRRTTRTAAVLLVGLLLLSSAGSGAFVGAMDAEGKTEQDEETYEAIVIFRNDDVQPYYKSEVRKKVDQIFVDEQVPVTEAVIPAPRNTSIAENERFCDYLVEQKRAHPDIFEYALHGYNHQQESRFEVRSKRYFSGVVQSEFAGVSAAEQRRKIARGTRILEQCTGERPEVFVPPFGTYSNETARILDEEGYLAVSGGGWYTRSYYGPSGDQRHVEEPFRANGLLHVPRSKAFVENWTTGEFYSMDAIRKRFERTYENNGVYVQMIHYPIYTDEEKLRKLRHFIQYVKGHHGVKFMTLGEFARSYESGRLERIEDRWVYEPRSHRNRTGSNRNGTANESHRNGEASR